MGHPSMPIAAPAPQRATHQQAAIFALTTLSVGLSALILFPFLSSLAWALALSVISYPLFIRLNRRLRHRGAAAGMVVAALAAALLVPSAWVLERLIEAGIGGLHQALPMIEGRAWEPHLSGHPALAQGIAWLERNLRIQSVAGELAARIRDRIPSLITISLRACLEWMLVFFTSFFLLRDGPILLRLGERLLPLTRREAAQLVRRLGDTIHATLFGIVAVGVWQGILGGFLFWWLGLPGPTIWGAVMALLAIVPYLGTFVVWIPVALFFSVKGEWQTAVALVIWGSIVIGLSDNLLYPILVGKRLHYHTIVVFFFLLGGVFLFGACGVVVGPMTLAVCDGLLRVARARGTNGAAGSPRQPLGTSPL